MKFWSNKVRKYNRIDMLVLFFIIRKPIKVQTLIWEKYTNQYIFQFLAVCLSFSFLLYLDNATSTVTIVTVNEVEILHYKVRKTAH